MESLYLIIDQKEDTEACEHYLNKRNNQRTATEFLKPLIILLVLRIKGLLWAPMAVKYANCLMGYFGTNLLRDHIKKKLKTTGSVVNIH